MCQLFEHTVGWGALGELLPSSWYFALNTLNNFQVIIGYGYLPGVSVLIRILAG